ncbi:MAG: hypothetical protein HQ515_14315 [Phycisphaeraceae bacterium]|nr:hypothetical protein [Phycisphaeraceae bacterium]
MTTKQYIHLSVVVALVALALPLAQGWAAIARPKGAPVTLEQLHVEQLPLIVQALKASHTAVEMGQKARALAELNRAQDLVTVVQRTVALKVKPRYANTVCPIMGSKIDAAHVPNRLVRKFNGQKIAFCCAGCPDQWVKLSTAQKEVKLAKAKSPPTRQHVH